MTASLSDLDYFINHSDLNLFFKAAMIHYQFSMIHPFIDANGRVARILNTLFLYDSKMIQRPLLQISEALSLNYNEYTDQIQKTNETADMEQWLLFFLPVLSNAALMTSDLLRLNK